MAVGTPLDPFVLDEIAAFGFDPGDRERQILSWYNFNFGKQRLIRPPGQAHPFGPDFSEFFHHTGNGYLQPGPVGVIGFDADAFTDLPSTISAGVEFDFNTSLLPGRNLPRAGRGRAASAGFDLDDLQGLVAAIAQNEFMRHLGAFHHR